MRPRRYLSYCANVKPRLRRPSVKIRWPRGCQFLPARDELSRQTYCRALPACRMILEVFFPPFRPGSAHVVGFWSISQWPCDMASHESEQRERRLPQRRAKSSDRSRESRHHGLLLTLFGRRTVLIDDEPVALPPDRRVANAADAQLTGKPPELGLGNDPEHGTEEALCSAGASASYGAYGLCRRSSKAIVGER
jgi:hypothetical protein